MELQLAEPDSRTAASSSVVAVPAFETMLVKVVTRGSLAVVVVEDPVRIAGIRADVLMDD